jgi:hypothetical protein
VIGSPLKKNKNIIKRELKKFLMFFLYMGVLPTVFMCIYARVVFSHTLHGIRHEKNEVNPFIYSKVEYYIPSIENLRWVSTKE